MAKTPSRTRPATKKKTASDEHNEALAPEVSAEETPRSRPSAAEADRATAPAARDVRSTYDDDDAPPAAAPRAEADDGSPIDRETHEKYERVKRGELHITDLQKMTVNDLHEVARKEGIEEYVGLTKQDLIFQILKRRINQNGLLYGEGVLEVLPDGGSIRRKCSPGSPSVAPWANRPTPWSRSPCHPSMTRTVLPLMP